jgi:CO dehydrogenase/acetyl-CoA synthase delta subunit
VTELPTNENKDNNPLKLNPELLDLLTKFQELNLEDFQMEVGEMELSFQPGVARRFHASAQTAPTSGQNRQTNLSAAINFLTPIETYPGKVAAVKPWRNQS